MSCTCKNTELADGQFVCPCDRFVHPLALHIGAGLPELPRQIAGFPEFRRAMLFALRQKAPLAYWRARDEDDFGIMLLEMWAYICDSLSFYDQVIAQEAYLRTAKLRPSLRRLVALLGYLPRPAVAATVQLAALAEGRIPVKLPQGTAFRSGGFDGNPPQVFELDTETVIHPFSNRWNVRAPHPGKIQVGNPGALLIRPQADLPPGSLVLLTDTGNAAQNQALRVLNVGPYTGLDGQLYTRVEFQSPAQLAVNTPLNRLKLWMPTQSAALWTATETALSGNTVVLDRIYPSFQAGEYVVIERSRQETRWYKANTVGSATRNPSNGSSDITINGSVFSLPRVPQVLTQLTLDVDINHVSRKPSGALNWSDALKTSLRVHYGMVAAGTIVDEAKTTLSPTDPLIFERRIEPLPAGQEPNLFLLFDKNTRGVAVRGQLQLSASSLQPDPGQQWTPGLVLPVEVYGNVINTSRGESVKDEILGNGNASLSNQTFKLKKKPLTYLLAPSAANDQGVQNTLVVYVNGIKWAETVSFYGKKPNDPVYIVRQNDEGDTLVTFGDGLRGQRLPSGANNLVAHYRFGAGQASPPADSIKQIAKPVKGLQSVKNPVPAAGGAEAEAEAGIRTYAPKSALILGRAVSIQDMEAVALSIPGVRAVQSEWRWHGTKQRTVVHIWYIGEDSIAEKVSLRLRNVTDPTTPIQVEPAQAKPRTLSLDVEIDPRYVENDVLAEIRRVLTDTEDGLLAPENIGIGKPLFRSRIFEAVLSVAGATTVRGISWGLFPFFKFAVTPGAGHYFDLEQGRLILNGEG